MRAFPAAVVVSMIRSRARVVGIRTAQMTAHLHWRPWCRSSRLPILALVVRQVLMPLRWPLCLMLHSAELRRPPISRSECQYPREASEVSNLMWNVLLITYFSNLGHVVRLVVQLLDNTIEPRRDLPQSAHIPLISCILHTSTEALSDCTSQIGSNCSTRAPGLTNHCMT